MDKELAMEKVLSFRCFDLRDRFPEPVATFREALELLQSDKAYLPEWSSEICCYLKSGETIQIPEYFYLCKKLKFSTRKEAEKWVRNRAEEDNDEFSLTRGMLIADPNLSIKDQIDQAFSYEYTEVLDSFDNDRICAEVDIWLSAAIDNLPSKFSNSDKDGFEELVEQNCGSSRWFIASINANTVLAGVKCYLNVSNNEWGPSVPEATCFKQYHLAKTVCDSLNRDFKARIEQFELSNEEMANTANKVSVDKQVIAHHEPSSTSLYHSAGMNGIQSVYALLSVKNSKEVTFVKDELNGDTVTVGIDLEAMDELAIAWCKHRKLQGALGGPVGKEWGSPDCDYD